MYINSKLRCTYLTNLNMRTDESTVGSSDRYDSFNKLIKKLLIEYIGPEV